MKVQNHPGTRSAIVQFAEHKEAKANATAASSSGGVDAATAGAAAAVAPPVRVEDLVRLYDALGQILGDVAALPGVAEDDEAVDALVARRAALRAQRCYHVAEAHAAADATRGAARAVALLEHATDLAKTAAQELEACAADGVDAATAAAGSGGALSVLDAPLTDVVEEMRALCAAVAGAKVRAHAVLFLRARFGGCDDDAGGSDVGGSEGVNENEGVALGVQLRSARPLLERLGDFDAGAGSDAAAAALKTSKGKAKAGGTGPWAAGAPAAGAGPAGLGGALPFRLADIPPAFEAVACKPLYFDVANNYLAFPMANLEVRLIL